MPGMNQPVDRSMIEAIYQQMWNRFCVAARHNDCVRDPYLNGQADPRRGVTALAYLKHNAPAVCADLTRLLRRIQETEPEQYYYPDDELHLTLLSVISCEAGLQATDVETADYSQVFKQALSQMEAFDIEFRGVSASPECIVIQGFPVGDGLSLLREQLRNAFKQSGVRTSIDSRYTLVTAHVTALRFRQPLRDARALMALCERLRDHNFGRVTITECELVFNNWYQNRSVTQSWAKSRLLHSEVASE